MIFQFNLLVEMFINAANEAIEPTPAVALCQCVCETNKKYCI